MPPLKPNDGTLVAGDTAYAPPYADIPRVQSTIHPAFFLKGLFSYEIAVNRCPGLVELQKRLDERLMSSLSSHLVSAVPESWFGDQATWSEFPNRWTVRIILDASKDAAQKDKIRRKQAKAVRS